MQWRQSIIGFKKALLTQMKLLGALKLEKTQEHQLK